jgi:hypothetical protein
LDIFPEDSLAEIGMFPTSVPTPPFVDVDHLGRFHYLATKIDLGRSDTSLW